MPKFLIVDDDSSTVHALDQLLKGDGHEVHAFTNGQDALNALAQYAYDAVLTDLEMPEVNGSAIVQSARKHHPAACIVVNTGRVKLTVVEDACHVFKKPLDYDAVARAIAACRATHGPGLHGQCYLKLAHAEKTH